MMLELHHYCVYEREWGCYDDNLGWLIGVRRDGGLWRLRGLVAFEVYYTAGWRV